MEEIEIKDFLRFYLSKIIYVIITILILVFVCNTYNLLTRKPLYEADTTLVLASENKNDNKTYSQSDALINQNLISTYSQILKSKAVLNKTIKKEYLKYDYNELSKMIDVTSVEDTEIIKISVKSKSKKESIKIANAIVPIFTKEVKRIYNIDNVNVVDKASASSKPCNINYAKENIIYILIGFFLSSIVLFLIYYFDTSIKSADEIEEKYNLNVIGIVPKVRG